MRDVDFYRADLTDAHFFGLDLRGSSLMKTKMVGANLHCARLDNCNLLGADLDRAKLENVNWGRFIKQEEQVREARKARQYDKVGPLYQESEEVCRNIRKQCETQGLFEIAGRLF